MTTFLEMLRPSFLLHHAVYGSVVVGFVCPLVGVYFLLRRLVFWGVALPQVSTAGIAFAFLLQGLGWRLLSGHEGNEKHLAIIGAVLVIIGKGDYGLVLLLISVLIVAIRVLFFH